MGLATAAIIGGSLLGAGASIYGANRAADAQRDAAGLAGAQSEAALRQQREIFGQISEQGRPAREVGGQALNSLAVLFGLQPALPEGVSPQQAVQSAQARQIAEQTGQPFGQVLAGQQQQARAAIPRQRLDNVFTSTGGGAFLDASQQAIVDESGNVIAPFRDGTVSGLRNGNNNPVVIRDGEVLGIGRSGINRLASLGQFMGQAPSQGAPVPFGTDGRPMTVTSGGQFTGGQAAGGQPQTLSEVGFNDPANATPQTREGVLQSLRDFPVSQFLRDEGMRGVQGSAAARGGLASGRTLRALTEYNQNFANANSIAPFVGGLQSLAGVGQSANAAQANNLTNLAGAVGNQGNTLANLALAQGNARAGAFQGMNQAVQGGLGNITQGLLLRDLLAN